MTKSPSTERNIVASTFTSSQTYIDEFEQEIMINQDPAMSEAERIQKIVDAKYTKADLAAIAKKCKLWNESEQEKLHLLLKKYESLFDGTLGTWDTDPVEIKLKETNCNHIMLSLTQFHTLKNKNWEKKWKSYVDIMSWEK